MSSAPFTAGNIVSSTVHTEDIVDASGTVIVPIPPTPGVAGDIFTLLSATSSNWAVPVAPTFGGTVVVAKFAGDVTTITAAIPLATALVPSPANPIVILVHPGVYAGETNPLVIPSFVFVIGVGIGDSQIIIPTTTTAEIFRMSANSGLQALTMQGASGAGGIGVLHNSAGASLLREVFAVDCETGFRASGAGTQLALLDSACRATPTTTLTTGFRADTGALFNALTVSCLGIPCLSPIGTGFLITGAGSNGFCGMCAALGCTTGFDVDDGGILKINGGNLLLNTTALLLSNTGTASELVVMGPTVTLSFALDVNILSATGIFRFAGCEFNLEKSSINAGASVFGSHVNSTLGNEGLRMLGTISIGDPDRGSSLAVGSGASRVNDMEVFLDADATHTTGPFTDRTTEASSATGSTFTFFLATTAGNTTYIGGDEPFFGVMTNTTTALVPGAGSIIFEFWSGATWTSVNTMATQFDSPHAQFAQTAFQRVQSEFIIMDDTALTSWATVAVNGETKYWLRVRIAVGITTSPIVEQVKLLGDQMFINANGFRHFFGDAMPTRTLAFHRNLLDSTLANASLVISSNITANAVNNRFANSTTDRLVGIERVPSGACTSCPLDVQFIWTPETNADGDVVFTIRTARFQVGDTLDGVAITDTLIGNLLTTITGATDQNVVQLTSFTIDQADALVGDYIVISVERDATGATSPTGDDYSGSCAAVDLTITGRFWN